MAAAPSADKIQQAKDRLDAQVREIVEWHFNPETGTPFWLEKAKSEEIRRVLEREGLL